MKRKNLRKQHVYVVMRYDLNESRIDKIYSSKVSAAKRYARLVSDGVDCTKVAILRHSVQGTTSTLIDGWYARGTIELVSCHEG